MTYGSPSIVVDLDEGGAPYDWDFQLQSERQTDDIVEFICSSGEVVCAQLKMSLTNTGQLNENSVFKISGAGNVQLYGGFLTISNMGTAPTALLNPVGQFRGRGFNIDVPLEAALPALNSMLEYSGIQTARDRDPAARIRGMTLEDIRLLQFDVNNSAQTVAGLRMSSVDSLLLHSLLITSLQ